MNLYDVLEHWDDLPLIALMRCVECGRRIGEVRQPPDVGAAVVYAGKATAWEVAAGDDPADPSGLFSERPKWARVGWCRPGPELAASLDRIFSLLPPVQCRHCRRGADFALVRASASPEHRRR